MSNSVLQIRDLRVTFNTQMGELKAVRGIDVDVAPGEILGVVGESGSGKSVSFLAAMGLLPASASISGSVMLDGKELIGSKRSQDNGFQRFRRDAFPGAQVNHEGGNVRIRYGRMMLAVPLRP